MIDPNQCDVMDELPRNHFGVIYADPPWFFHTWHTGGWRNRPDGTRYYISPSSRSAQYDTMPIEDICALPVKGLAAPDCVLFMWGCWPTLKQSIQVIEAWGFEYKTCAFSWIKANGKQMDMFHDDEIPDMLLGYWTRANSEYCLLGTKGKPKRLSADVRQAIIEPRRQHSRKPDCVYERIERLVDGPYLELFARKTRPNWTSWGNEVGKFDHVA